MPGGTLKRWNGDKGFGFIQPEDGGEDVFCHVSGLLDGEGSVLEGDRVQFRLSFDERKGKDRAVDVVVVGGGSGGRRGRSRSFDRGGGGGRGGGFGGGEVRPGDWECPECGANVFASKTECFKCGARKPSGYRDDRGGRDRDFDRGGRDYDRGGRDHDRRDYDRGGRDYDRGGRDYDRRDFDRGGRDYDRRDFDRRDYDRGGRDYDRGGRDFDRYDRRR